MTNNNISKGKRKITPLKNSSSLPQVQRKKRISMKMMKIRSMTQRMERRTKDSKRGMKPIKETI